MADETPTVPETTGPTGVYSPALPVFPTVTDLSEELSATPEQITQQATDLLVDAAQDLVSGKSPAASNTLRFNALLILVGIGGTIYTMTTSGDVQQIVPFLVSFATGAANSFLRCITTGPVLTQAMQKMIGSYAAITPQQK